VRGRDEIREKPRTLVHFIFSQILCSFICFLIGFHLGGGGGRERKEFTLQIMAVRMQNKILKNIFF